MESALSKMKLSRATKMVWGEIKGQDNVIL